MLFLRPIAALPLGRPVRASGVEGPGSLLLAQGVASPGAHWQREVVANVPDQGRRIAFLGLDDQPAASVRKQLFLQRFPAYRSLLHQRMLSSQTCQSWPLATPRQRLTSCSER